MFTRTLMAGWGDMDFNSHMRNTSYLDKSADLRMLYFASEGFSMAEFRRLRLGPVVVKDEMEYIREIHLLENMTVSLTLAGLADDGSRMILCNEFFRENGELSARVTSKAGWLDLEKRQLTVPPENLQAILRSLTKTADFQTLPSRQH